MLEFFQKWQILDWLYMGSELSTEDIQKQIQKLDISHTQQLSLLPILWQLSLRW